MTTEILRYAAFSASPEGGNPAGVVLDASGLDDAAMQRIAAEVGYSETAFVTAADGDDLTIRYFSPEAEVPFCGHATIATGVAWGERHGAAQLRLATRSGLVVLDVEPGTHPVATLTSVAPHTEAVSDEDLAEALAALGWEAGELDPALPVRVGFAGAKHLILAAATVDRIAALDYDYDRLKALMAARDWTTLQLVYRGAPTSFHCRDPFPPGGVVEDPATGAAAAALGGYLRELELIEVPAEIVIHQGTEMGRPSLLRVAIPAEPGSGIRVSGTAVVI
ncbi:MAG TPA: PhzF family phenazine biosynthesis isomerase [Solirubrobacteraceae bacterium]